MSPIHPHSVRNKRSSWMPQWRGAEKFPDKFRTLRPDPNWDEDDSMNVWEKSASDLESDLGPKPLMPSTVELEGMSYAATNDLILEFDDWIFKNISNTEEIEESVNNIKILEDHQYSLLKARKSGSKREAKNRDLVLYSDLWVEMEGLPFIMLADAGRIKKGTVVTMVYYSRMSDFVIVRDKTLFHNRVEKVAKTDIDIHLGKTKGINYYNVGKHGKNKRSSKDNVHEAMYNQFDPQIRHWVRYYNRKLDPKIKADPNILKSMLFQESRFGIFGRHLTLPPYVLETTKKGATPDYVPSRYNVGQTFDAWAHQQYMMMEEMAPEILKKYGLDQIADTYMQMDSPSLEQWNPEGVEADQPGAIVRALDEFNTTKKDGENLNARKSKKDSKNNLFEDYDYMIRTAARWWFHCYETTLPTRPPDGDWVLATKLYNTGGTKLEKGGPEARVYQKEIFSRVYDENRDILDKHPHPELISGELNIDSDEKNIATFHNQLYANEKYVVDRVKVHELLKADIGRRRDGAEQYLTNEAKAEIILVQKTNFKIADDLDDELNLIYLEESEENTQKILDTMDRLIAEAEQYVKDKDLYKIPWHQEVKEDE